MQVPETVQNLIQLLEMAGYEAYAVGGCVRDSLLGSTPHDWDICTSATPDQMKSCFSAFRSVDTGLRHGTLTVLVDHTPFEVTTFRADGEYKDHRRPDQVRFVTSLRQDLMRRDFTINAMAMTRTGELIDWFGGQRDLLEKRIRCVGDPSERFGEDALRILRALRFSSRLGFDIDPETARAMKDNRHLLKFVSVERIYQELLGILVGQNATEMMLAYSGIFTQIIPELALEIGFEQHNPHHAYDVFCHTALTLDAVPPDPALRLTMLLHDIGKPHCFTRDAQGIGHFYGHPQIGERIAGQVLTRLRADNRTKERVLGLIRVHDIKPEAKPRWIKRRLNDLGEAGLTDLFKIQRADAIGQSGFKRAEKLCLLDECEAKLVELMKEGACYTLDALMINGSDLIKAGWPAGKLVGQTLSFLLGKVIDGDIANERRALMDAAMIYAERQNEI